MLLFTWVSSKLPGERAGHRDSLTEVQHSDIGTKFLAETDAFFVATIVTYVIETFVSKYVSFYANFGL